MTTNNGNPWTRNSWAWILMIPVFLVAAPVSWLWRKITHRGSK